MLDLSECGKARAELVFVLDSSTTVGPDNWKHQIAFLQNLIKPFDVSSSGTRVGVILFNTEVKYPIKLSKTRSKSITSNAIGRLRFTEGLTFMGEALEKAGKVMATETRKGVPKIVILVTDGKANGEVSTSEEAAKLKKAGVTIITVGITSEIDK